MSGWSAFAGWAVHIDVVGLGEAVIASAVIAGIAVGVARVVQWMQRA